MPLALDLLGPISGAIVDLGCGEGQLLRAIDGDERFGCDLSEVLLRRASAAAPVVRCRLPNLSWLRDDSLSGATCVLVLEHLSEIRNLLAETARVLEPGGVLALVMNHPAYTSAGAGPVVDLSDGEILWRWGAYFEAGSGREPAGAGSVVFHHRSLGELLNTAAACGLMLERLEERGLSPEAVARDPALAGQEHFPRLLGVRWRAIG